MPPLTLGSRLDVDEAVGEFVRAVRAAEDELRAELERVVSIVATDPKSSKRYREAQVRGLLGRLAEIRADLDGQATLFTSERLGAIYRDGMGRAQAALGLAGQPSFTAVHREALEVLASDTFDDLARATEYLDASVKRTIREAAKIRTTVGAAAGTTVRRDTNALVRALETRGVTGFVDAAGRGWRLSTYAEMVVRTKSAHAYNTGTVLRAEETGTSVFEILDGTRSGHPECLAYNRDTCTGSWALAHPVEHPNCVRSFSPLPLHVGPVDHGVVGGPTAGRAVADEVDRREADAIARLADTDIDRSALDLSGLPRDRPFSVPAGMRAHDATLGPARAKISRGRLHVIEDGTPLPAGVADVDDLLETISARVADALPDGLDDSIRSIVYTAKRCPGDDEWSARYGFEFTAAGTSNGPGVVLWRRGIEEWSTDLDRWIDVGTIDHEAGHSLLRGLSRKIDEERERRAAAGLGNVVDDAAPWIRETLERLDLDPIEVPVSSLANLADTEYALRVSRMRAAGEAVDEVKIRRTIDREIEEFATSRSFVMSGGRVHPVGVDVDLVKGADRSFASVNDYVGRGMVPGRSFTLAADVDANRLEGLAARWERMRDEARKGKRETITVNYPDGGFDLVPKISSRVARELGPVSVRLDPEIAGGVARTGRASYANQPERSAVTRYAASVGEGVEDWAETWRLYKYDQRNDGLGVNPYTGKRVRFADVWPNRAQWIRDAFDLAGLEP